MINSHVSSFAGLPVLPFTPGAPLPADPSAVAWRLEVEEFDADPAEFAGLLAAMLNEVPAEAVRAVVVGEWGEAYERPLPVDLLVDAARRWTGLRALFLADLVAEQCEISWLTHGDVTPLLAACPALEVLGIRGAQGLRLEPVRHTGLRELRIESGGLPGAVVRAVGECDLPALHRLDLWLGVADYGGDATVDDLATVLAGDRLPALRHLALCNAEHADAIAAAVADAPVVDRLEVLDLSMGVLGDAGAAALLAGRPLTHLRRLDLHHHFLSDEVAASVVAALPGVEVDVTDPQTADKHDGRFYYFTAVGE
ncbi:STM4015 family protein [Micromonospora sp. WMMD998]|uniref:STM4015 family protein n=1 Tax=Micromonospora sp. WMMD998 TaxID=3016092 RepID=UPI00249C78D5|nr:STM4015 family protein [Micromonospora sp. WMMD998]WFE40787.1 STM4015 family protein [Micromonospora sp. WMMD998]